MKKILKEIGLTDSELQVYLALLKLGDSTRSPIVNKAGIAGSKVYEILERLKEKGLISAYTKDKIKHFKAANPKQILYYLEEQKNQIKEIEDKAKKILPSLLMEFQSSKEDQEVEIFTGLKGLEIIFREQIEIMKKGETNYVIGGTKGFGEDVMLAFFRKIHFLREKKNIKTRMLYNLHQKKSIEKLYSSKEFAGVAIRYIEHTSPVAINIYKDRTVIIVFGEKINAIHIKSQEVADSFLSYFNLLWKVGKK